MSFENAKLRLFLGIRHAAQYAGSNRFFRTADLGFMHVHLRLLLTSVVKTGRAG